MIGQKRIKDNDSSIASRAPHTLELPLAVKHRKCRILHNDVAKLCALPCISKAGALSLVDYSPTCKKLVSRSSGRVLLLESFKMLVLKMSLNGDSAHVAGLSRCVVGIDICVGQVREGRHPALCTILSTLIDV